MTGFETDLDALEDGITKVIEPAISYAGQMWGKLKLLERGEPSRMTGHGTMGGGVALAMTCAAFANRYVETANDLIGCAQTYTSTLETFRDTLRQVVASYRENELRQEENFRNVLRDI